MNLLNAKSNLSELKQYGGGKALSLYQMQNLGLNVPEWFCLGSDFYRQKLDPYFQEIRSLITLKKFQAIHKLILNIDFSASELEQIHKNTFGLCSVRSSANLEDGTKHSFAGIYETYLFVSTDLESYIKKCWASVFTTQHIQYLQSKNIPIEEIEMSIIIQRMINADRSGIYFQASPNGNINEKVIVAGYGIGEGVVDGTVPTDTYRIGSLNLEITKEIQKKNKKIVRFDNGQTTHSFVEKERQNNSCLSDDEILSIIHQAKKYTDQKNVFFDFEWAIEDGILYFLQARPITTVSQNPRIYYYDNSNIIENYPGITLPLTASNLKRLYGVNLEALMKYLGFFQDEIENLRPILYNSVDSFHGRFYYVVNHWHALLETIPFIHPFLKNSWNQMIGITQTEQIFIPKPHFLKSLLMSFRIFPKISKYFWFTQSCMKSYQRKYKRFEKKYKNISLGDLTVEDILKTSKKAEAEYFSFASRALLNDLIVSLHMKLCLWCIDNKLEVLTGHTEADPKVESYKLVLSTNALFKYLEMQPETLEFLRKFKSFDKLEEFDPAFYDMIDTHLELYGSRTIEEMKFETPSLTENPDQFIRFLCTPKKILTGQTKSRKEKPRTLLKRLIFPIFLKLYRNSIRFRELSRFNRVRVKDITRQCYLELGRRLAQKDIIEKTEDIFYFEEDRIRELFISNKSRKQEVAQKKEFIAYSKNLSFPDAFLLNSPFNIDHFQSQQNDSTHSLKGTGCCQGLIEAECVVMDSPHIDGDVSGKILVTKTTDPGWVFLMMQAKGLIVERGNLLSHAAIIGRELNIPTIINVPNITKTLKSGKRIKLNGATGEITPLYLN